MTAMICWAAAPPLQNAAALDLGNPATSPSPFSHVNVDNAIDCLCGADTMLAEAIHIGRGNRAQFLSPELASKAVQLCRAVASTIGCAADLLRMSYDTDSQRCAVPGRFANTLTTIGRDMTGGTPDRWQTMVDSLAGLGTSTVLSDVSECLRTYLSLPRLQYNQGLPRRAGRSPLIGALRTPVAQPSPQAAALVPAIPLHQPRTLPCTLEQSKETSAASSLC